MNILEKAKKALQQNHVTFVAVSKNGGCVTSEQKGIAPMMQILEQKADFLAGAAVADKVIGKAAAFLLIKGHVKAVYAEIISQHALDILQKTDIAITYQKAVPYIINRNQNGMCPMEETVLSMHDAEQAFVVLQQKVAFLAQQNNQQILLQNLDKIHTTDLGVERIQKNIGLSCDVVQWCKDAVKRANGITKKGKNWYVSIENAVITINASSYTVITAHKQKCAYKGDGYENR